MSPYTMQLQCNFSVCKLTSFGPNTLPVHFGFLFYFCRTSSLMTSLVVNASRTSFFCLSSFVSDSLPSSILLIFLFLLLSWLVSMLFFREDSFLPSVLWTSDWGEYFIICFQLSLLMYLVGLNSRYMTIQSSSVNIRLSWIEL